MPISDKFCNLFLIHAHLCPWDLPLCLYSASQFYHNEPCKTHHVSYRLLVICVTLWLTASRKIVDAASWIGFTFLPHPLCGNQVQKGRLCMMLCFLSSFPNLSYQPVQSDCPRESTALAEEGRPISVQLLPNGLSILSTHQVPESISSCLLRLFPM